MNIFNDAPSHDVSEEPLKSLSPVAPVGRLHNVATGAITLRNQSLCSDDYSVIILTLLVLAREVANSVGVEMVRKETSQELDRSIANLTDYCRAVRQDSPKVQTQCAANVGIAPGAAAVGLAARSLTLGTIGEKLCDIAGRINGESAAATNCDDIAAQCSSDRALMPSRSVLTGVISYSSSLNECWFW